MAPIALTAIDKALGRKFSAGGNRSQTTPSVYSDRAVGWKMKVMKRVVSALMLSCAVVWAASGQGYTVAQLLAFMRSSIQQKLPDQEVAKYVSKMKLTEKLDPSTIEQLQSDGLGPKTVAALKEQMSTTSALQSPPVVREAAKPAPIPGPPYEDEQKIIGEMTEYALNYAKRLPDFLCTQVTRRYADPRFPR